jgi:hypothetical protein
MKIPRVAIHRVVEACLEVGARKAEIYLSPVLVVRAARRHKPDKRNRITEIVLTIGAPNYAEREFIALCNRVKEPFPVRKIQLHWYPEKKKT